VFIYKLIILVVCVPRFLFAGTVAGNGGEPLLHFLEATRASLVETVRDIRLDPKLSQVFCEEESYLSSEQQAFCKEYFNEIADPILALNISGRATPFVLRLEPLLVVGPDGHPMPVSARTELGARGPIEFHLDSIKLMAPKNLLHLVAHEFQHKIVFRGQSPSDNESIGAFQSGRLLIDSVASALVKVASKRGRVRSEFILRDHFECTVRTGSSQFGTRVSTQRWFLDSSLMNYRLSLSEQPSDPLIYSADSTDSKIVFQLHVSDGNHCDQSAKSAMRWTRVRLWRVFDDPRLESVQLTNQTFNGYNPLCDKNQKSLVANYQSFQFDCRYFGTATH
jgi:hypothetical protein